MKFISNPFKKKTPAAVKPASGRSVEYSERDLELADISGGLTPQKVTKVLATALEGSTAEQCQLALEICEKDWDIGENVQKRILEVSRTDWRVTPFDDQDTKSVEVADYVNNQLKLITGNPDDNLVGFHGLLKGMMSGLLPGFSCLEVVWDVPGESIAGFQFIEPHRFHFKQRSPRLITEDNADGVELTPYKFIFHRHKGLWGSLSRGGLIRPLAWLYVFKNLNLKDLLRYTEKVGIPFIYANISDESFKTEAAKISSTLRRFSGDGAGVFSDGVKLESMERKPGGEAVFMKCQELFAKAIPKLILGTDATGTADAKFSNGQTGLVMSQKYREDDCDCLTETIRNTIIKWIVGFKYGFDTPLPFFEFDYAPVKDRKSAVEQIEKLSNAGYEVDVEQVEEETGWRVTRKVESSNAVALSADSDLESSHANVWQAADNAKAKHLQAYLEGSGQAEQWQPLQDKINYCLQAETEEEMKQRFVELTNDFETVLADMDSENFQESLEAAIFESYANTTVNHSKEV